MQRNQLVRVTHWQRLVTRHISIHEQSTYKDFRRQIKLTFSEEIDDGRSPPAFRIYTLPARFDDVDKRELVDDESKFRVLRDMLLDDSVAHPVIYVWNYDNVSPAKLPDTAQEGMSETGSAVSRNSITFKKTVN